MVAAMSGSLASAIGLRREKAAGLVRPRQRRHRDGAERGARGRPGEGAQREAADEGAGARRRSALMSARRNAPVRKLASA